MKPESPVIPDEKLPEVIVAEHQDEYQNLPVIHFGEGVILCRWSMSSEEKQIVAQTGRIYVTLWTFNKPAPFVTMQVEKPWIVDAETETQVEESINAENHALIESHTRGAYTVLTWKLKESELEIVSEAGDVYLFMNTEGKPITPMLVQVEEPVFEEVLLQYISTLRKTESSEKWHSKTELRSKPETARNVVQRF